MRSFVLFAALLLPLAAQAQGVTIGAAGAPAASAALEIKSTTGGLLLPRLTAAQREAIPSPTNGLLVFQTDSTPGLYYYIGGWLNLSNGLAPDANGNAGTSGSPGVRVSTLAGSTAGYADGTGAAAQFNPPVGVACDGSGNLFVSDYGNRRIRKIVVATGAVSTLAGSGTAGNADGIGTAAQFNTPNGLAYDGNGNLFVADPGNNLIRQIVVATGVVTTLAGGAFGYADGTGTNAQFRNPTGVAYDGSGTLYVAEQGSNAIRRLVVATGVVSTLAGTGSFMGGYADGTGAAAQFNQPAGVACDASGNVFVADVSNSRIRKIVVATGVVSTLAGSAQGFANGTGTAASFNFPTGLAYDGRGNLLVADRGNARIRKVVAATGAVSTLAGTGTAGTADGTGATAQFSNPISVACEANGTVYVADQLNNRIRVIK